MKIINYKEKEGLIIRYVTWGLTGLLDLFGSIALYYFFPIEDVAKDPPVSTFWGTSLIHIPFFDVDFRLGLLICLAIFAIVAILLNRFLINNAKAADFLIDTEYEVRKVSWPPKNEYWGSSVAVIISVVIIGTFVFIVDILLTQITSFMYR
jgi:preprotein translocase SecE subunit